MSALLKLDEADTLRKRMEFILAFMNRVQRQAREQKH